MKIIERNRSRRSEDRDLLAQVETMTRQYRRVRARNTEAFDQGFAAAVRMLEAGADIDRLRDAARITSIVNEDTQPYSVPLGEFDDAPDTDVDVCIVG